MSSNELPKEISRRDFLKSAGAAAAGLTMVELLAACGIEAENPPLALPTATVLQGERTKLEPKPTPKPTAIEPELPVGPSVEVGSTLENPNEYTYSQVEIRSEADIVSISGSETITQFKESFSKRLSGNPEIFGLTQEDVVGGVILDMSIVEVMRGNPDGTETKVLQPVLSAQSIDNPDKNAIGVVVGTQEGGYTIAGLELVDVEVGGSQKMALAVTKNPDTGEALDQAIVVFGFPVSRDEWVGMSMENRPQMVEFFPLFLQKELFDPTIGIDNSRAVTVPVGLVAGVTPEAIEEVLAKPFWESSPEEIFGKLKDGGIEGGVRPDLYDAYYEYDGVENVELAEYFNEERVKMLQEFGKDVAGLGTPEAVLDAYLAQYKEINAGREKGEYAIPMLSLFEIHEYQKNIRNVPNGMSYEPPAKRGPKNRTGNELGGFGGLGNLRTLGVYDGYYFDTENGIQKVHPDKGIAEFYGLSGLLEAIVYYPDKRGGYLALLNTNPPSREPNVIPIAFNSRRHREFRAGEDYINRDGRANSADKIDSQSESVMDIWRGNTIDTASRERIQYPQDLWDIVNRQLMVTTNMGTYKAFFSVGFPPGAAREAQIPDDVMAMIPICRILDVFDHPK